MINTDTKTHWSDCFSKFKTAYPAEQLIRILKGNFPKLNFDKNYSEKIILDMGCANGRNTALMAALNFKEIIAVDLSEELLNLTRNNIENDKSLNTKSKIKYFAGQNNNIPISDNYLDFACSWGVSYYMTPFNNNFTKYSDNVKELSRVLKKDGILILSVEQYSHEIYKNTKLLENKDGEYLIDTDGIILRRFKNSKELEKELEPYFYDIQISNMTLDCFGKDYSSFTIVARKK